MGHCRSCAPGTDASRHITETRECRARGLPSASVATHPRPAIARTFDSVERVARSYLARALAAGVQAAQAVGGCSGSLQACHLIRLGAAGPFSPSSPTVILQKSSNEAHDRFYVSNEAHDRFYVLVNLVVGPLESCMFEGLMGFMAKSDPTKGPEFQKVVQKFLHTKPKLLSRSAAETCGQKATKAKRISE